MKDRLRKTIFFILILLLVNACSFFANSNEEIEELIEQVDEMSTQIVELQESDLPAENEAASECFPDLPAPDIQYSREEDIEASRNIRYYIEILNYDQFPDALFKDAPELPPCGSNDNASRTWISIYSAEDDAYIYGYCAMSKMPDDIWFAGLKGEYPSVYIVVHDRQCDIHYISAPTDIP